MASASKNADQLFSIGPRPSTLNEGQVIWGALAALKTTDDGLVATIGQHSVILPLDLKPKLEVGRQIAVGKLYGEVRVGVLA